MVAQAKRKKGGGAKLARTETVTVRLNPKLRYLVELAARLHRRTASSYLEWAAEQSLNKTELPDGANLGDLADALWNVEDSERYALLALRYPSLLTHDELVLWKLIRDQPYFWKKVKPDEDGDLLWTPSEATMNWVALNTWWDTLQRVAKGEQPRSVLPKHKLDPANASRPDQQR